MIGAYGPPSLGAPWVGLAPPKAGPEKHFFKGGFWVSGWVDPPGVVHGWVFEINGLVGLGLGRRAPFGGHQANSFIHSFMVPPSRTGVIDTNPPLPPAPARSLMPHTRWAKRGLVADPRAAAPRGRVPLRWQRLGGSRLRPVRGGPAPQPRPPEHGGRHRTLQPWGLLPATGM